MDKYVVLREIGKGAYGTAYIVQHKVTGDRFVLKKVRLARQSLAERQGSVLELQLLSSSRLRHRNILTFHDAWVESGGAVVCMLVELCESGDLSTQLRLRQPTNTYFPELHLHEMLVQVASALAHIHKHGVCHRDIKSSNLLITGEGCIRLADFGLACVMGEGVTTSTVLVGTPGYMAPQLMLGSSGGGSGSSSSTVEYDSYKNDIWGLGCVLYEASALRPPFHGAFNMAGLCKKVHASSIRPLPSHFSEDWHSVVRSMLEKDEAKRPTAAQLLELPWLQEARARVAARFGPDVSPKLHEGPRITPGLQALLDQLEQQQAQALAKRQQDKARIKALQAKFIAQGQRQSGGGAPHAPGHVPAACARPASAGARPASVGARPASAGAAAPHKATQLPAKPAAGVTAKMGRPAGATSCVVVAANSMEKKRAPQQAQAAVASKPAASSKATGVQAMSSTMPRRNVMSAGAKGPPPNSSTSRSSYVAVHGTASMSKAGAITATGAAAILSTHTVDGAAATQVAAQGPEADSPPVTETHSQHACLSEQEAIPDQEAVAQLHGPGG